MSSDHLSLEREPYTSSTRQSVKIAPCCDYLDLSDHPIPFCKEVGASQTKTPKKDQHSFFCLVSLKSAPNKGTPSLISRDAPGGCGALLHLPPRQTAWPPPSLHRPGLDDKGGRSRSIILPTRYPFWSLHVSKKLYKSHPLRFCFHWDTPICLWGSSTKPLA